MFADEDVRIPLHTANLAAHLTLPSRASGIVLFAHGAGSDRRSRRTQRVAAVLQQANLDTVLLDLLTTEEEQHDPPAGELRLDIPLLARCLAGTAD